MLSPSMMTKSKGTCWRVLLQSAADLVLRLSPVPVSPITAKRVESFASGSVTFCAVPVEGQRTHKGENRCG